MVAIAILFDMKCVKDNARIVASLKQKFVPAVELYNVVAGLLSPPVEKQ
jgi:hypothetical protein